MRMNFKSAKWMQRVGKIIILLFSLAVLVSVALVLLFGYKPDYNALGALGTMCMDVICIIIIVIMTLSLTFEGKESNKTTKFYICLLLVTIWALFFDFLTWAADGTLGFGGFKNVFTLFSLCSGSVIAFFLIFYLRNYFNDIYNLRPTLITKICALCNIAAFVVTVVMGVTKQAYVYVDGHYETGALYDVITIIPVITVLFVTGYAVKHVKTIGLHDVIAVAGYITVMICGVVVEAIYSVGTTYVATSIADIFIYIMLQNKVIEKWIKRSNTDRLTGFFNRQAYESEVKHIESNEEEIKPAYVSIDVNGLKSVNDTLGHEAGDELIIGAAECLRQCFGAYGKLFRIGGDEFVALIHVNDFQLGKIQNDIDEVTENWSGKLNQKISFSCGYVSAAEAMNMTLNQVAALADKRMYEEKRRYYQEKGVDRRGQRDAHVALCALYSWILKINAANDSYQIISANCKEEAEKMGNCENLSEWLERFAQIGQLRQEEEAEYFSKANVKYINEYFSGGKKSLFIHYRRSSMIEIIPASDYSEDNKNLYFYVKTNEEAPD